MDLLLGALMRAHPASDYDESASRRADDLLPDFEAVAGMNRRSRALVFSPRLSPIPARDFYRQLLQNAMAFNPSLSKHNILRFHERAFGATPEGPRIHPKQKRMAANNEITPIEFLPIPSARFPENGVREWMAATPPLCVMQPIHIENPWAYRILRIEFQSEKKISRTVLYFSTEFYPLSEVTKLLPITIQRDRRKNHFRIDFSLDDIFWETASKIDVLRLDLGTKPKQKITDLKFTFLVSLPK